jgi:hypothetical protein
MAPAISQSSCLVMGLIQEIVVDDIEAHGGAEFEASRGLHRIFHEVDQALLPAAQEYSRQRLTAGERALWIQDVSGRYRPRG